MGGSPPPGSKKGGYKPVVRSCVEKHQRVALCTAARARRRDSGARPSLDADGYPTEEGESSLHESAKGKLVWKDGGYFHDEFGRTGLFSSGVGSAGDPLGHSYQYGERICDYYLGALELPKPSDPK